MTDNAEIHWPDTITINSAKKLAKAIKKKMGICHNRALHAIAIRYGFNTWIAFRQALETDTDRAEKMTRSMKSQQRRARKWADGNATRAATTDAMALSEPGWVGKSSSVAALDPGMRPADAVAANVAFYPHKI